jgi:hypothetical protein
MPHQHYNKHTTVCRKVGSVRKAHAHTTDTHTSRETNMHTVPLFFMRNSTHRAIVRRALPRAPDAPRRRLRAPPAAPWLRTPRNRLPSRHRRPFAAVAASTAAAAAARRLLPTAVREARTGARAAATGHPNGQAAVSAAAHAAAIEPAAFAALPAALAAASAAGGASRGLHTGHTERAETMHERPKGGSERWRWTPEGGQGWGGGGGCGRARDGGVQAFSSSK